MLCQLKQCDSRRQVYFGLPNQKHAGLNGWVSFCNNMRKPKDLDHNLKDKLEKIRYNIEIKQKFRDWHLVTVIRSRNRYMEIRRCLIKWRALFLLTKYKILHCIFSNNKPLIRYRFLSWRDKTKWLRAVEFNDLYCKKRFFNEFKVLILYCRNSRLRDRFFAWKRMTMFLRKLKRCVSY